MHGRQPGGVAELLLCHRQLVAVVLSEARKLESKLKTYGPNGVEGTSGAVINCGYTQLARKPLEMT
jgi:hypothetical protein